MKETLTELQGEINDSIFIVGDFNTSWLLIGQADQNIIMNIEDPNDTIVILDLMDIRQQVSAAIWEYAFGFSKHTWSITILIILSHKERIKKSKHVHHNCWPSKR